MDILPNALFAQPPHEVNLFDYQTSVYSSRNKINLAQNVISFLVAGNKKVNFSGTSVEINSKSILIILQGHCLMTEDSTPSVEYRSLLLFFSQQKLEDFLVKYHLLDAKPLQNLAKSPYFLVEKDAFIEHFMECIQLVLNLNDSAKQAILPAKFEEIMFYLIDKYGDSFLAFLQSSTQTTYDLMFRTTVEANKYKALSLEEIAFLCNMSISTFKRHFEEIYGQTPGKWLKLQKLDKAKEILQLGTALPSELHKTFGYENLSNFSTAFKRQFGINPSMASK